MINTGPGKAMMGGPPAPMNTQQMAAVPLAAQAIKSSMRRAPMRKAPTGMPAGRGGNVSMGPGFRSAAGGGGGGVPVMRDPTTGATKVNPNAGPMGPPPSPMGPKAGYGGPPRIQGDPLMEAGGGMGPVANMAPPMFEPPMMGGGGMMPGNEQNSMLMDQYGGQRDPRFRY